MTRVHVIPMLTAIRPQIALVTDDHVEDLEAVEREIDAVSNPDHRTSSVPAIWEETGEATVLHARDLVDLRRL